MKKGTGVCLLKVVLILLLSSICSAQQTSIAIHHVTPETFDTNNIKLLILSGLKYHVNGTLQNKYLKEAYDLSKPAKFRYGLIFGQYYEALQLWRTHRYDEAIDKCRQCIDGLDSMHSIQYSEGYPLSEIRNLFNLAGQQEEKLTYFRDKVVLYTKHGPIENSASCFHGIAECYAYLGNFEKAIEYYIRAREVYKTFDPAGCVNEQQAIGSAYLKWGNLEKAEEYLKSALNETARQQSNTNYFNCYHKLGDLYFLRHDYKQAFEYYFEGGKYLKECTPEFQTLNLVSIASVYQQIGSKDNARFFLDSAERIRKKEDLGIIFSLGEIEIDYNFYKYYISTGNEIFALKRLKAALYQAQSAQHIPLVQKYANELYLYLLHKGDSIAALRYHILYHANQDSVNKLNSQARIATYEIDQEAGIREKEIEELQVQKFRQRIYYWIGAAFIIVIVLGMISRFRYIRRTDKEKLTAEFRTQLAKAETKALRAQMNPHFIFNCLNSINCFIIDQEHEMASEYLIKFSKLIRLILDNSSNETISIAKELETLQLYIQLESARYDNKFNVIFNIDKCLNTRSVMIPPLLLQPFVENAIWHGLMHKETAGTITIGIHKLESAYIKISITDDGIGRETTIALKSKSGTHKSHGLEVTAHRIEMMNKINSSGTLMNIIDLHDKLGCPTGTMVELIIPVLNSGE